MQQPLLLARAEGAQDPSALAQARGHRSLAGHGQGLLFPESEQVAGSRSHLSQTLAHEPPDAERGTCLPPLETIFRQWADLASEALLAIDATGKVLLANRACAQLLGLPVESLRGTHVATLLGSSCPLVEALHSPQVTLSGRTTAEWEWIATDGRTVPLRIVWSLLPAGPGQGSLYLASVQELSALHALEERLRQAQRFEAMGTLATGIAHDLKNFLAGMLGCARFLLAEMDEGDAHYGEVKSIAETANTAIDLVNRLLALTRTAPSQMLVCSLNQLVERTALVLRRTVAGNIRVRLNLCEELPSVLCNPAQIEQVLMNLGINAAEAMPQGGELVFRTGLVELHEEAWQGVPPGRYAYFSVQDSGVGIPPYLQRKIFEPLFTTKQPGKGSGMGLAVAEGIVREHRGMIAVDSRVGVGSRFTVYLPVAIEDQPEPTAVAPIKA
ncbi:MAG: ATP-binding protein [bacterium]|nr:ATP-binding protein [candidate division KSB1 bacterium]MDH7559300.1 ATP-binding protein [bacterium]